MTNGEGERERCGAPTQRGGVCRKYPMAGAERCHHHNGLAPTEAEQAASRTNRITHGYFVSGFLDDEEKQLFARVLEGTADVGEIKRELIAALSVRIDRMLRWEAEGKEISGFLNEAIGEFRKLLESVSEDELRVKHSWDDAEVAAQVQRVLGEDPDLLVRMLPPEVQGTVREAIAGKDSR